MIDFGPRSTAPDVPDVPGAAGRMTAGGSAGAGSGSGVGSSAGAAAAAAQGVLDKLTRLAGAFRAMPQSKLLGRLPDGRSRAEAGHALADALAKAAQGIDERSSDQPPLWRAVPFVGPFAVGDQLMVLGNEFCGALAGLEQLAEPVWSAPDARAGADQVLAHMDEQIRILMLG